MAIKNAFFFGKKKENTIKIMKKETKGNPEKTANKSEMKFKIDSPFPLVLYNQINHFQMCRQVNLMFMRNRKDVPIDISNFRLFATI
ncbi:MAG: hypothetical protein RLZZ267_1277 [Bacillota bacterium]|jgi:hypothetical protein